MDDGDLLDERASLTQGSPTAPLRSEGPTSPLADPIIRIVGREKNMNLPYTALAKGKILLLSILPLTGY
jgi:hypothetical protein